ncbi:hypothetical protein [Brachybacterium sp. YJGR34]|uniref:hypothetical protein n=1 Tax=Brachybacterium sp. YJGR34 TaxID=2059911 RepID=UPI000E0BEABB|nr:hypothetical protein [Brachybacterium sp. YJGR34]
MDSEFGPAGSVLIVVATLALAAMMLLFGLLARQGRPERNFATADAQDLRSLLWTSEATWRAAHRAHAPWLFAASAGLVTGGAVMTVAMVVKGPGEAVPAVVATLCVALFWVIACCSVAVIAGRIAAKRVLAQQAAADREARSPRDPDR